ncbi:MAG TPA: EutP/PduV family microcompartment system protein [Pseudonocardia sp.]
MSITLEPADPRTGAQPGPAPGIGTGPAEMTALLDELRRLTDAADRPDLSDRLTRSRARVTDPTLRIVVVGEAGQGMSTLVDAVAGAPVTADGARRGLPVVVRHPGGGPAELVDGRLVVGTPRPLLARGVELVDAPGSSGGGSPAAAEALRLATEADAVLFVSDASQEYTRPEIGFLTQLQRLCGTVVGVVTKIDLYPRWADVQGADRRHLTNAGLDIPLLPVSALLSEAAQQEGDEVLGVESGVPQLLDFLRGHVVAEADTVLRRSVVNDVRTVSDHLALSLNAQLDALHDPARAGELVARLDHARAAADRLRQQSAGWQLTLGDGMTELTVEVEHDLRQRLRGLVRAAEADIMTADPAPRWERFDEWLQSKIAENVRANFVLAHVRSRSLSERVAERFAGEGAVSMPEPRLDQLGGSLDPVHPLEELDSRKAGLVQRVISSMRGSYGGILMVGVLTSLAGLALVNPWSIGAGVLLGANTFREDRTARTARRQAEAKVAVARLMDDVIFQVGNESRARLREVHRTLRDHFTALADETLRSTDDALAAAQRASQAHEEHRDARFAEVQDRLSALRGLRVRAAGLLPGTSR